MDMTDFRGLATVLCALAFVAVVFWAYGPSRKRYFDDAAQLPFADEEKQADEESSLPVDTSIQIDTSK